MARIFGRIEEIFLIPEDINKIGLKIKVNDEVITIIKDQTEDTINIYKNDFVFINKTIEDNQIFYDLELLGDVDYE